MPRDNDYPVRSRENPSRRRRRHKTGDPCHSNNRRILRDALNKIGPRRSQPGWRIAAPGGSLIASMIEVTIMRAVPFTAVRPRRENRRRPQTPRSFQKRNRRQNCERGSLGGTSLSLSEGRGDCRIHALRASGRATHEREFAARLIRSLSPRGRGPGEGEEYRRPFEIGRRLRINSDHQARIGSMIRPCTSVSRKRRP